MREDVFVVGSMNRPREVRYPDFEGFSIPDLFSYLNSWAVSCFVYLNDALLK